MMMRERKKIVEKRRVSFDTTNHNRTGQKCYIFCLGLPVVASVKGLAQFYQVKSRRRSNSAPPKNVTWPKKNHYHSYGAIFYIYVFKFIFLPYLWQLKCLFYQHPSYVLSYCWLCFGLEEKKEKKIFTSWLIVNRHFERFSSKKDKKEKKNDFLKSKIDFWIAGDRATQDLTSSPLPLPWYIYKSFTEYSLILFIRWSPSADPLKMHSPFSSLSLRLSLCAQGHGWWTLHRTKATIRYMAQSVKKI